MRGDRHQRKAATGQPSTNFAARTPRTIASATTSAASAPVTDTGTSGGQDPGGNRELVAVAGRVIRVDRPRAARVGHHGDLRHLGFEYATLVATTTSVVLRRT